MTTSNKKTNDSALKLPKYLISPDTINYFELDSKGNHVAKTFNPKESVLSSSQKFLKTVETQIKIQETLL